jgi:hypothetical protein
MPRPAEEEAECDLDGRGPPYDCGRRFVSGANAVVDAMLVNGGYEYDDTGGIAIGIVFGCDQSVCGG